MDVSAIELTNLSYEALQRYFTRLSQSGYMKYSNVDSLIVLLYIQEIVDRYDLDIEEQNIVNRALSCIQGNNCMIPHANCNGACN